MANSQHLTFEFSLDMPLQRNLAVLDDRTDRAVAGVIKHRSHIAIGWAKQNARWTDRTGAARSGLRTETKHKPKVEHTIYLFHSVPYGIWLEIRFAGKYAIIIPTILDQGPKMMRTFQKLWDRLDGGSSR